MTRRFETVCILGMSFCGSTMLSGIAYNIPGAFSGGELHWLKHQDEIPDVPLCSACGENCAVLRGIDPGTPDDELYAAVAQAASASILVTSDKSRWIVERYTKPRQIKAVVLFKRPEAQLASDRRHHSEWAETVEKHAAMYAQWYSGHLHWVSYYAQSHIVVSYEKLAQNPQQQLEKICASLDLPDPKNPLAYPPSPWHNVGGNASAWNWGHEGASISLDERWRRELSPKEIREIRSHDACTGMFNRLQALAI
jgi:hypothetical protein